MISTLFQILPLWFLFACASGHSHPVNFGPPTDKGNDVVRKRFHFSLQGETNDACHKPCSWSQSCLLPIGSIKRRSSISDEMTINTTVEAKSQPKRQVSFEGRSQQARDGIVLPVPFGDVQRRAAPMGLIISQAHCLWIGHHNWPQDGRTCLAPRTPMQQRPAMRTLGLCTKDTLALHGVVLPTSSY